MPKLEEWAEGAVRLRVRRTGDVEMLDGERWVDAPLRQLARDYAVGEGPWPWLREHGVRRPSPSGTAGYAGRRKKSVLLHFTDAELERIDAIAKAWGLPRNAAVVRMSERVKV
jgi:hypothetical protein